MRQEQKSKEALNERKTNGTGLQKKKTEQLAITNARSHMLFDTCCGHANAGLRGRLRQETYTAMTRKHPPTSDPKKRDELFTKRSSFHEEAPRMHVVVLFVAEFRKNYFYHTRTTQNT